MTAPTHFYLASQIRDGFISSGTGLAILGTGLKNNLSLCFNTPGREGQEGRVFWDSL